MVKTLTGRFKDSFNDSEHEDAYKYTDWLRATIVDYTQNLRRMVTVIILLMAVFELISQSSPTVQITISSFRISKGSVALDFLPAIIAYIFLQIIIDTTRLKMLQESFTLGFKSWNAKAEENDLDLLITPPRPIYWFVGGSGGREATTISSDKVEFATALCLLFSIVIAVLAFEIQAYYLLFRWPLSIAWTTSAFVAFFCIIMTFVHLSTPSYPK